MWCIGMASTLLRCSRLSIWWRGRPVLGGVGGADVFVVVAVAAVDGVFLALAAAGCLALYDVSGTLLHQGEGAQGATHPCEWLYSMTGLTFALHSLKVPSVSRR